MSTVELEWWKRALIYQIYPRSFQDSNGDGIGDLEGIRRRLEYVKGLGVDCVWLSPIYPSPMADFGYDVSDYRGIHPDFGTMADFDRLLEEVHQYGMKLVLDFVPNHSSDRHPWFIESRTSRENPKRDWYIWKDPKPDGSPPNNWMSAFSGPAWTFDEETGQYYLHSFLPEQPDLNWFNPELEAAMFSEMEYWLEKGVDGLRIDVILRMIKDPQFRDEPPNPAWKPQMPSYSSLVHDKTRNYPLVHDLIKKFRRTIDKYPGKVMIGETYLPAKELMAYYGKNGDECHFPFNFGLITEIERFRPPEIAFYIEEYYSLLPEDAWPNWVFDNHDVPRIVSPLRAGPGNAGPAAVLLFTLGGTITAYYGDEIAMSDADIPPDRVRDPKALREPDRVRTRDSARTPMQWDDGPNAGFSTAEPWLPVSPDYRQVNVKSCEEDRRSFLHLFRRLVQLRRNEAECLSKEFRLIIADEAVLAYSKGSVTVALNFSDRRQQSAVSSLEQMRVVFSSAVTSRTIGDSLSAPLILEPHEGLILKKNLTCHTYENYRDKSISSTDAPHLSFQDGLRQLSLNRDGPPEDEQR